MSKATTKEVRALLDTASEMFDETGCVPGIDGEEVRAETMVPDAKEYISESIDNPEVLCDSETWDRPGFSLVLSWLAQKWLQKCHKLAPRGSKNPEQHLTKEQQKACLNSAAAELIREMMPACGSANIPDCLFSALRYALVRLSHRRSSAGTQSAHFCPTSADGHSCKGRAHS